MYQYDASCGPAHNAPTSCAMHAHKCVLFTFSVTVKLRHHICTYIQNLAARTHHIPYNRVEPYPQESLDARFARTRTPHTTTTSTHDVRRTDYGGPHAERIAFCDCDVSACRMRLDFKFFAANKESGLGEGLRRYAECRCTRTFTVLFTKCIIV